MGRKGTRVLLKRPAGKNIDPTDMFVFNKAFTSERIKFKINQIQQDLSVRPLYCTIFRMLDGVWSTWKL